jgi:glycosyltransferase involved in cell wall biosynthesis
VIGGLGVGGAERQLLELAAGLDRARYRASVCSLDAGHEFAEAFGRRGVPLLELQRHGSFDVRRLSRLRKLVAAERPDVVHAFLVGPSLYTRLACLGLRPRPLLVVSERSIEGRRRRVVRFADRALAGSVDCFVANAEAVRDALLGHLRPRRPRIEVIPNGFDLRPPPPGPGRDELRAALGVGAADTLLLAVGRLAPQKDYPTLLDALARLSGRLGLRLAIAGDGPERPRLEALLRERPLPVTLLGTRRDVPELLRAADLFVLSSSIEGFPNVVGEALLAERPVVATAAGGVPEVMRDGIDGRVVPVGDADALARAIASLLDDPEAARRMAASGARRVRESFSLAAMVRRTEALYDALLSEASAR